ncbi:hypothetical protein HY992_06465 [Candidatus Micrarchaeota archaeon]|nr:hypothetical protein [Candidatus Micrarchaeota archaeon]
MAGDASSEESEKKVVCGKCNGSSFLALVRKTPEVVVISFSCTKCKNVSKVGIRRSQPQEIKSEPRQQPGLFSRLTGAFGGKKGKAEGEESAGSEEQWGWEENLDALLEEK